MQRSSKSSSPFTGIPAAVALAAAGLASATASNTAAAATWAPFVIRQANTQPATTPLFINGAVDGSSVTTQIDESGEKTGYGTSDFDGQPLGNITSLNYTRLDSGVPDPYVNIWVRDGLGHSAVISPVANMTASGGYTSNDVNGLNLQNLGFNIYETDFSDLSWLGVAGAQRVNQAVIAGGQVVTLADIASLIVDDPGAPYSGFVGTGAPKNNTGFNLIFGDTQGNFATPIPYNLSNVNVVPEPGTFGLLGLAGAGSLLTRRRGRRA